MDQNIEDKISDIWADDRLARQQDARFLIDFLVNRVREKKRRGEVASYVLNLDARWGQGKSFFLERFVGQLEAEGFIAANVNAWRDDHADDPLIAVLSAVDQALKPFLGSKKVSEVFDVAKRNAGTIALAVGKGVIGTLAQRYVGQSIASLIDGISDQVENVAEDAAKAGLGNGAQAISKITDQITDSLIASFQRETRAIDSFKINVTSVVQVASEQFNRNLPFFVIVDELDRCRPTYAVRMLERIKHVFDTDNVVFLIATDTSQLRHSIRGAYGGEFDGLTYLQRFFDRTYVFREVDHGDFLRESLERIDLEKINFPTADVIVFLKAVVGQFSLTLREFKKVLEIVEGAASAWTEIVKVEAVLLFPLAATFVKHGDCSFDIPLAEANWNSEEDVFLESEYRSRSSKSRKYSLSSVYNNFKQNSLVSLEKGIAIRAQDPEGRYVREQSAIEFNKKLTSEQQRAGSVQSHLPALIKSAAQLR